MMVSGLNHLLGRVMRSDLVQSGRDTSPDVVAGLARAPKVINHDNITLGTSENTHLGSSGLIWASGGR